MSLNKKLLIKKEIESVAQLLDVVQFLIPLLVEKTCFLLKGDLAAGKTTFVSQFAQSLQLTGVASPTFALHHVYSNEKVRIDHFDLYRLENAEQVETSGVWEVLAKPKNLVFIEWPERIVSDDISLDEKIFEINFEKISEKKRIVSVFSLELS